MKKVVNCKVAGLFGYYNFGLGSFSVQGQNLKVEFKIVNTENKNSQANNFK